MKYKVGDRVAIKLGECVGNSVCARNGAIKRVNKFGYIVDIGGETIFFTEDEIELESGGTKNG